MMKRDDCFRILDDVGGHTLQVAHFLGRPVPLAEMTDAIGTLGDRAAGHGYNVLIEFMPAARVMDPCVCVGPPDLIAKGALKTIIGEGGAGAGMAMASMAPPSPPDMPVPPDSRVAVIDSLMVRRSSDFPFLGKKVIVPGR